MAQKAPEVTIKTQKTPIKVRTFNSHKPRKIIAEEESHSKGTESSKKIFNHHTMNLLKKEPKTVNVPKLKQDSVAYQQYIVSLMQQLEPRDQMIVIPFIPEQDSFTLKNDQKRFEEWLGDMQFSVTSSAFSHMLSKKLTFEQVKVFCSQNILLNLLLFLQNVQADESYQLMKLVNRKMKDNLEYLMVKYPLTKEGIPNKKLREAINKVNNLQHDDNDLIDKSGIQFTKNKSSDEKNKDDYTSKIMELLNYLVTCSNEPFEYLGKTISYYKAFTDIMEKIFEWVEFPSDFVSEDEIFKILTEAKEEEEEIPLDEDDLEEMFEENGLDDSYLGDEVQIDEEMIKNEQAQSQINFQTKKGTFKNIQRPRSYKFIYQNKQEQIEDDKGLNEKQLKEYREKVKSYTSFKIGSKLNPNTPLYTENEIQFCDFNVKSTAMLRIMTKWIQHLKMKIQNAMELLMKRNHKFKTNQPGKSIKLDSIQKNKLFQAAQKHVKELVIFEKQMLKECFGVQANIAKHINDKKQSNHIPKHEYFVGLFGTTLETAASTYLLNYLNKLISILINIPEQANQEKDSVQNRRKNKASCKDANLITFKVSDLLRCKCSSHQDQILRILTLIQRISENKPELFKIVRIKDRLELGTKDILININFANKILCEIQLGIVGEIQEKVKMYDKFSHYLYELHRSSLGPLMECSCIWAHLDQRSKKFIKYIKPEYSVSQIKKSITHVDCSEPKMQVYNYSFVCSLCENYYSFLPGLIKNRKCVACKTYYECRNCIEARMSGNQLKQALNFTGNHLEHFYKSFTIWKSNHEIPSFGFLIPKKANTPKYYFCQRFRVSESDFFIRVIEKDPEKTLDIQIIYEMKNDSPEEIRKLAEEFFILEWTQSRFVNKTLRSDANIKEMEQAKIKREEENRIAREKRQTKKKQIQKRKEEVLAEIMEEDSDDDEKKREKNKKAEERKAAMKDKLDAKTTNKHKESGSRANSAHSSRSSKSRLPQENKQITQVIITKFANKSEQNDSRIDRKTVNGCIYILLLGFYMKVSEIRTIIRKQKNINSIKELLNTRNQVFSLQEQEIQNQLGVQYIKDEIKHLSSVYEMYIDENKISDLMFLKYSPKLRILSASKNSITQISPLEGLKSLHEINLQNNYIKQLDGLQDKQKLVTLNLANNQIASQNDNLKNICGLQRLKTLSLNDNWIRTYQGLENLPQLEYLDLSINSLDKISRLQNFKCLKTLNLSNSFITKIENLDNLVTLQNLYLSYNQIPKIQNLSALKNLKVLHLCANLIAQVKQQDLRQLTELTQLNLSHNKIKLPEQKIFTLPKLIHLNLSKNSITSLSIQNFQSLKQLKQLILSYNFISRIRYDIFKILKNLEELHLVGNPYKKTDKKNQETLSKMKNQGKVSKIK